MVHRLNQEYAQGAQALLRLYSGSSQIRSPSAEVKAAWKSTISFKLLICWLKGQEPVFWHALFCKAVSGKDIIGHTSVSEIPLPTYSSNSAVPVAGHESGSPKLCGNPCNDFRHCYIRMLCKSHFIESMLLCQNHNQWKTHVEAIVVSQRIVKIQHKQEPRNDASPVNISMKWFERQLFALRTSHRLEDGIAHRIGRIGCGITEKEWMSLKPEWKFIELDDSISNVYTTVIRSPLMIYERSFNLPEKQTKF